MPLERMLRIYFLQQWYGLSDPEAEDAIYDRRSFQDFLGLDPASDRVPDETRILNFRHLLEKHQLQERFFEIINAHLEKAGLRLQRGTIVDAPSSPRPRARRTRSSSATRR